jgi:hypothetical protein
MWTLTVPDKATRSDHWVAEQVWGYAEHDIPNQGREKRYTRKIHFTSPNLTKDVLLVYDRIDDGSSVNSLSIHENDDLGSFGGS